MGVLNEEIVLDFYLNKVEEGEINFLKRRENYILKVKEYINELKKSKEIHDKIQVAKELWKVLFESAMSYIDPDKRGYNDLFEFFDAYVDFEELIFASDSFYRDHTLHCLWVYFLQEYITRNSEFSYLTRNINEDIQLLTKMKYILEEINLPDIFADTTEKIDKLIKMNDNADSIRCISALSHDLGYPLKKIKKINKNIKGILPYFSIENYNEFDFKFDDTQTYFIENFLKLLSNEIKFYLNINNEKINKLPENIRKIINNIIKIENTDINNIDQINIEKGKIKNLSEDEKKLLKKIFKVNQSLVKNVTSFLRYSNDFEKFEHGIMSAFLLVKTIKTFRHKKYSYIDNKNINFEQFNITKIGTYQDILQAIADHTSDSYQIQAIDDFSALLTFTDELEEFSRISRADQNRQFINEFCKTDIHVEDGVLHINFIFDNKEFSNIQPELAFKGRCKRFLTLFNIADLDEKLILNLKCIGKLPYDKNTYELELRKKYVNIKINGVEQNIPDYLNDRQFYTKEEYMKL